MKKILFIAHYFPPIGGAGVQRSVKFVKYLPEHGFLPLVLTGPGRTGGQWSPEDASLSLDVPAEVSVIRADWSSNAGDQRRADLVAAANKILREQKPGLIFVSMSPFEDALIAAELAARHNLPWVADLRDPWALDEFQVYPTRWHRQRERRRMAVSLASAASIIMNTPEALARFRATFPALGPKARVAITNGHDAGDFPAQFEAPRNERFTVIHSGYLHTTAGLHQRRHGFLYRLLGKTETGVELLPRSHYYLMQALEQWLREEPTVAEHVRVELVGVPAPADEEVVRTSSARKLVSFSGYVPHTECLRRIRSADLLFLPMHRMPAGRRSSIVPGKTYEYMASGRTILAAVPEGDARDFITQAGSGLVCQPSDAVEMIRVLRTQYEAWRAKRETVLWNRSFVEQFERRRLTETLVTALDNVIAAPPGR